MFKRKNKKTIKHQIGTNIWFTCHLYSVNIFQIFNNKDKGFIIQGIFSTGGDSVFTINSFTSIIIVG